MMFSTFVVLSLRKIYTNQHAIVKLIYLSPTSHTIYLTGNITCIIRANNTYVPAHSTGWPARPNGVFCPKVGIALCGCPPTI